MSHSLYLFEILNGGRNGMNRGCFNIFFHGSVRNLNFSLNTSRLIFVSLIIFEIFEWMEDVLIFFSTDLNFSLYTNLYTNFYLNHYIWNFWTNRGCFNIFFHVRNINFFLNISRLIFVSIIIFLEKMEGVLYIFSTNLNFEI